VYMCVCIHVLVYVCMCVCVCVCVCVWCVYLCVCVCVGVWVCVLICSGLNLTLFLDMSGPVLTLTFNSRQSTAPVSSAVLYTELWLTCADAQAEISRPIRVRTEADLIGN
jgi:L-cystine uptake protein TcyP (sodium:dicarboxylate symporter family)